MTHECWLEDVHHRTLGSNFGHGGAETEGCPERNHLFPHNSTKSYKM